MADRVADLEHARDAVARESWSDAYDLLRSLEPPDLEARDLEGLAEAAWWGSKIDEAIAARQRAYSAFATKGDEPRAAYLAVRLAIEHFERDEPSVGAGWLKRAQRHLLDRPECVQHGYLTLLEATIALNMGELDFALAGARHGSVVGRRFADPDLIAMATVAEGLVSMASGHVDDGLALLDEAMIAVIAGELTQYFAGAVYCSVIEACLEVIDLRRAGEWNEAAREWCLSIPPESPYPGQCRVNRAEVARLRGELSEAEAEATRATEELAHIRPEAAAVAHYTLGEVRLRLGDSVGAEAAFARAHELGIDPQPGLARLRLEQGNVEAARTALRLSLSDRDLGPSRRAVLLAAQVDAEIEANDLEAAAGARDKLEQIAGASTIPALQAMAATARGSLALAKGEASEALTSLRYACATWQELKLPYETAQARTRFGRAIRASGNEEDAALELRAALTAFERLGATREIDRVCELLGDRQPLLGGLTKREAEVLRLVAAGMTNRDISVELVISEHTVARHLQNIFAKLLVSSRSAATAFAFEHGLA